MSIVKKYHFSITANQIKAAQKKFELLDYKNASNVIYPGQVPTVGFVLIYGKMRIIKNRKFYDLFPGSVVGVKELIQNKPLPFMLRIYSGAKVLILDKSTVLSVAEKERSSFAFILDCLIEPM